MPPSGTKCLLDLSGSRLTTYPQMGLLDIIRKPNKADDKWQAVYAEFITTYLLGADLPLTQSAQDAARKFANGLAVRSFRNISRHQDVRALTGNVRCLDSRYLSPGGVRFREAGKEPW